jgi:tRNA (mo5U34)-methyltransferase
MSAGASSHVRSWRQEFESRGWWHSFDLPDGQRIDGVCKIEGLRKRLEQYPIPEDLRGARVLDIGAWDGWYSFEMERRGAEVLAIDCWDNPRFHQVHAALGSRVEYRQMDVYELRPDVLGRFDIVLFMGVLYHLKHPLLGLERVCSVSAELVAVDSFILAEEQRPVMEFYETDEFGGQTDNWCAPSLPCLMALCRAAGFARVEHRATLPDGACIACYRNWAPAGTCGTAPELIAAFHHLNFGINFATRYDEYVSVIFRPSGEAITVDEVRPRVAGYGVRPVRVMELEAGSWQANFKLPPGLSPGWHEVTISVGDGPVSNAKRIAVDVPIRAAAICVIGSRDGTTWKRDAFDPGFGNVLAVWVAGLPENADRANIRATLDGTRLTVLFVEPENQTGLRQINLEAPEGAREGDLPLIVSAGSNHAQPVTIKCSQTGIQ